MEESRQVEIWAKSELSRRSCGLPDFRFPLLHRYVKKHFSFLRGLHNETGILFYFEEDSSYVRKEILVLRILHPVNNPESKKNRKDDIPAQVVIDASKNKKLFKVLKRIAKLYELEKNRDYERFIYTKKGIRMKKRISA